jgi:hypothetical protein
MTKKKEPVKYRRIAAKVLGGIDTKYKKEEHIPLLIELFSEGKAVCNFCAAAEVAQSTFYDWLDKNEEFAKAYAIAKQLAFEWWMDRAAVNLMEADKEKFNAKLWQVMMRNRFGFSANRAVELPLLKKCKGPAEQLQCIINYVSNGDINPQESQQLAALIMAALKVDEHTEVKERLEKAEIMLGDRT